MIRTLGVMTAVALVGSGAAADDRAHRLKHYVDCNMNAARAMVTRIGSATMLALEARTECIAQENALKGLLDRAEMRRLRLALVLYMADAIKDGRKRLQHERT